MPIHIPKENEIEKEPTLLPSEGRHDVVLVKSKGTLSKRRDDMLVWDLMVDTGSNKGKSLIERFLFSPKTSESSLARLKCIADVAGFPWPWPDGAELTIEQLAAAWPIDGSLRYSIEIDHRYSLTVYAEKHTPADLGDPTSYKAEPDDKYTKKSYLDVGKSTYEAHVENGFKGNIFANCPREGWDFETIYQPVSGKAEKKWDDPDEKLPFPSAQDDDAPETVEEAQATGYFDDDFGLPY